MPVDPSPAPPESPAPHEWRVHGVLPAAKLAGAVLLLIAGFVFADGDPVKPVVAGIAAAGLLVWAARDLLHPVRLRITPDGLVVATGFASHRELPWSTVNRIGVRRSGLRAEMLDIDCDDSLHVFTRADLNADPHEVAAVLQAAQHEAIGRRSG